MDENYGGKIMLGTDIENYREMDEKAKRNARTMRLLYDMELHTTIYPGDSPIGVFKVIGGWIYYNYEDKWSCFVPDRSGEV